MAHDHKHDHDHDHDHQHCDHDHSHEHDHSHGDDHANDHSHDHSHEHDHSHGHDHAHSGEGYFLEQICTVATCLLLGGVALKLYFRDQLNLILAEDFRLPVMIFGVALLLFSIIRGITLWSEAGKLTNHEHDHGHDHGHSHGHNHGHGHGHDHDDGHSHGWAPVRFVVLLPVIVLGLLGMPNQKFLSAFTDYELRQSMGLTDKELADSEYRLLKGRSGETITPRWDELFQASLPSGNRQAFEGKTARLKGQFYPLDNDRAFTVSRLKISCCAADAIPMKVRILSPESLSGLFQNHQWVEVTGQIQFRELEGESGTVPVIVMEDLRDVRNTAPDPNWY